MYVLPLILEINMDFNMQILEKIYLEDIMLQSGAYT